jgi:hypothetical protein
MDECLRKVVDTPRLLANRLTKAEGHWGRHLRMRRFDSEVSDLPPRSTYDFAGEDTE